MTRYFVPNSTEDYALLPPEIRNTPDLERQAEAAEADVLAHYTKNLRDMPSSTLYGPKYGTTRTYTKIGDHLGVFLQFYEVDADAVAADDDAQAFKRAMKRTIAEVVAWRMLLSHTSPIAVQETRDQRHIIKSPRQEDPYPPHWMRWLAPYSTLEPLAVL